MRRTREGRKEHENDRGERRNREQWGGREEELQGRNVRRKMRKRMEDML